MTQAGPVHITDLSTTRSNLVPPSHFTKFYEYKPQFWFQPVLRPIADL